MRIKEGKHIDWGLLPAIFALAWPTMLEQLMQTAVQYVDTAMVGTLGTQATAAVGATATINWLFNSSIAALGVGFLSYIARAFGAGEKEKAVRAAGQSVLAVLVVGLFFTALALGLSPFVPRWMQVDESLQALAGRYFFILYSPMLFRSASIIFGSVLRAAGDSKTPMRVGICVNLINVALNFFLIYPSRRAAIFGGSLWIPGAGWGVEGAAAASAVAYAVGGIIITAALWKHPKISPRGQKLRPDGAILRPCLQVALPNMLQRFATSLGYVAFAAMINSLGEIATAAHTIANTVESAFYVPGYGMQAAAATLAGNAYGARDKKRMRDLILLILLIEVSLMIVSGGLLFAFAPGMVSLFSREAAVVALGGLVLRMVAVSEPFYGVSIVLEGIMHGTGNTFTPFVFNLIGMWGLRIVGTFLCTQLWGMGLTSAWACMILHNLFLFGAFMIQWARGRLTPRRENRLGGAA